MDFPQEVLNKFFVRDDYIEWIEDQGFVYVYLDLSNMLHWQDNLGWKFTIEDFVDQLLGYKQVREVKIYYGLNNRDLKNSKAFHARIRATGAILRDKPMKYIKKTIDESLFFQRKTMTLFDTPVISKIKELIDELNNSDVIIEEPKCNFDVEMAMDMLDDAEKMSSIMLFSGDSDMKAPLERLKVKGKNVAVCGVRGQVSAELFELCDKYIDFGKFYNGKRRYFESENPTKKVGPRE